MGVRVAYRAAAFALMEGYKAANDGALRQVYKARPATIYAPTGFIDGINESSIVWTQGPAIRGPVVDVIFVAGLFDSAEAADSQDALVDGFADYVRVNFHAAGGSTLLVVAGYDDIPNYVPDWIVDAPIYYATRVSLAGTKAEASLI